MIPIEWITDELRADRALTIEQQITHLEQELQSSIRVSLPAECQEIWDLAVAHGVPVAHVFLVNRPLKPGSRGSLNGTTGEIWVYHPGTKPLRRTLITLLHEIAHIVRKSLSLSRNTIDEYWDEERETYQMAYTLVQKWRIPHAFFEEELEAYLEMVEQFRALDYGIAHLIGSHDAQYARRAYTDALLPIIVEWGWNLDRLVGAVQGWDPSEEHFAALMDLNRGCLRTTWIGSSNRRETMDFGPVRLDLSPTSAHLLYAALQHASEREQQQEEPDALEHHDLELNFLTINDSTTLAQAIGLVNSALLAYRTDALRVRWIVYGDSPDMETVRIYRVSLQYKGDVPRQSQDIWLLFGFYSTADLQLEAAWQRYVLSWQQEIRQESLKEGLLLFWNLLGRKS